MGAAAQDPDAQGGACVIYLSGVTNDRVEAPLIEMGVGLVVQPGNGYISRVPRYRAWAADNGCYTTGEWSSGKWGRMMGSLHELDEETRAKCLFVVVPDVPFDQEATLGRFRRYAPVVRGFGLPLAYAIQGDNEPPWDDFDVAFLGGTTEWKVSESAYAMTVNARNRGKWVHMGRVNSWERLDFASTIGCDSSDGTFIKHGPPLEMAERIKSWLDQNEPRLTQMGAQVA
jgi:hypothetical protein